MAFVVKKRCVRCRKALRENGTCRNENCVLYVPVHKQEETPVIEKPVEADKEN